MNFKLNKSMLAVAVSSLLVAPLAEATNGYFSDGYGAKSRGMGGTGVAIAQETGSILQNPAAAATLGKRYDAAIGYFSPHPRGVDFTGNPGLTDSVSGRDDFFIPFFGYNMPLNNSSSVALTVSALGGMNTDYSTHPFQNFGAMGNLGIDLKQAQIAGTYAIELSKGLSVGATLGMVIQQFQARGLGVFTALPDGSGGTLSLSSDNANFTDNGTSRSTGIAANLGIMYDMGNGISFGAQYAPEVDMSEFDEYAGLFAEKGNFDIPSHYSVGVAWQASSSVVVAFDYRRINYTDVPAISNDSQRLTDISGAGTSCLSSGGGASGDSRCLGGSNGAGFGWDDQDVYKIGVAVDQGDGLTTRIGWNHGKSPIGEEDVTLNVIAPATTQDHLTLGFTKALDSNSEVTMDFIRSFENSIEGDAPAAFGGGKTKIYMSQKFLELNYARRF